MIRRLLGRLAMVMVAVGTGGCDGFLTPQASVSVDDSLLTVVRVAANAPPLAATEVSFWMVRGQQREVQIQYLTGNGYNGKCLRLVIPAEALLRHADGSVVEPGDSVQATIRVVDPDLFLFEFEPAGIRFNPAYPAQLEIRYRWMDQDLNGDGATNALDEELANRLGIWRQERTGGAWTRVPSTRDNTVQEIRGSVVVFTRYALASD